MEIDEEIDNFYYSFKSSDDTETHSANTTDNFRITLKEPINLNGDWEVGLSSLFIPHIEKYEFVSLFTVLIHIPNLPSRNPDNDKYWLKITLQKNLTTFSAFFLSMMTKIQAAIRTFDAKLNPNNFITYHRGPYNWYPSYRVKWGTLIAITKELAEFLKIDWRSKKFLKKDFSEKMYGLRTIEQGDRGRNAHNLLQMNGNLWITLNPTQKINIGTFISLQNNLDIRFLMRNMKHKDEEIEKKSKIHLDKLYHNTILVKTNLISPIVNSTSKEYRNIIRVVALPQVEENHQYDFSPIFYFPLRVDILNVIKIKLKRFKFSDIIDHITFEGDTSIVILHFRKRHSIL